MDWPQSNCNWIVLLRSDFTNIFITLSPWQTVLHRRSCAADCQHRFYECMYVRRAGTSENFRGTEVTFGKDSDVIDVHSTIMRHFSCDQLTNTGGGTFFTVGGMGVRRGGRSGHSPLEIRIRTNHVQKIWSQQFISDINCVNSCNDSLFSEYDTHTAQEPNSLFWYHAVMSCLQFAHVRSFACRDRLRNLGRNFLLLAFTA